MLSVLLIISSGYAKEYNTGLTTVRSPQLGKVLADNPERTLVNIGNWGYFLRDNGESAHTPSGSSGGFYPRGTEAIIYQDGVLVGGYQEGNLKVSGQIYRTGTERGYIDASGNHITQSDDPRVRLYRIRKDWETLTADQVRQDAAEQAEIELSAVSDAQIKAIMDQYEKDWKEWPTELGAPFYDLNNNGIYEPGQGETPGIADADQVVWMVITDADTVTTRDLYGTDPIGIEQQMTLWAYNQPGGGLGQIIFKLIRLINKGQGDLEQAYISIWSDPDVGNYTDDLVGVDVEKSLMYVYNGGPVDDNYAKLGLPPPSAGYDFFAGPIVEAPGETAIFNLKEREGYRNLPASSFGYFVAGGDYSDPDPYGSVEAAREYYNLMRGFAPLDDLENPTPWLDENGLPTLFPFSGDPVAGTGHIDSNPADRRMLINSGPFVLAEGDTQDIVVALVGGLGSDNLTSITAMKNNDVIAQQLFDDLFQSVPSAPPPPVVKAVAMDDHVILDWGSTLESVYATEQSDIVGYKFQGYNVYQLPSPTASKDEAVRIATYDLIDGVQTVYGNRFLAEYGEVVTVPVQYGIDTGIKRHIKIEKDAVTGLPLYQGSPYYFAVTAYNYNADPQLIEDKALETSLTPLLVTITPPPIDTEYGAEAGNSVEVVHSEGPSDGSMTVTVVDPSALTGHDYEAFFTEEEYYLDVDGIWKNVNSNAKAALVKILDCTGSTISVSALASEMVGTYDLTFNFDMHCGSNWVDGIMLTFPDGITINSWDPVGDCSNGGGQNCDNMDGTFDAATNSITWGNDARSEWGAIEGNQTWVVNIQPTDFPINVGYSVYDDAYDGTQVDAIGTATATELGYAYKTIEGWYVRNVTTNQIVTPHQTQQGTAVADNIVNGVFVPAHTAGLSEAPIFDGLQGLVNGPELGIKQIYETDADDNILDQNVGLHPPSLGTTGYIISHRDHANSNWAGRTYDRFDYWNMDDIIIDFSETSLAFGYSSATVFYETVSGDPATVPFSIYRRVFPTNELKRLFVGWWERDGDNIWSIPGLDTDWQDYGAPSYEPIYAWVGYDSPTDEAYYDPAKDADYIAAGRVPGTGGWATSIGPLNYPFVTATMMVMYLDGATPPWGNKIWFATNKANTTADKFTFTAPSNTVSDALAKEAVKMVNVFPNPYYANNSLETNRFDNFMTFTHLPQKATIKIFSLDGRIVRTLEKDSDSQYLAWDLRNYTNLPVASGVYIAHVDMDMDGQNLGSKILKLFVVQANQILEYY